MTPAQERTVSTEHDLRALLNEVRLGPSGVTLDGWLWEVVPASFGFLELPGRETRGWMVRASFLRPDRETNERGRGAGRWEFIAEGATESAVVKTCWLLAELVVRHELMEAFTFRDARVFDPHHTVDELSMPHRARGRS